MPSHMNKETTTDSCNSVGALKYSFVFPSSYLVCGQRPAGKSLFTMELHSTMVLRKHQTNNDTKCTTKRQAQWAMMRTSHQLLIHVSPYHPHNVRRPTGRRGGVAKILLAPPHLEWQLFLRTKSQLFSPKFKKELSNTFYSQHVHIYICTIPNFLDTRCQTS